MVPGKRSTDVFSFAIIAWNKWKIRTSFQINTFFLQLKIIRKIILSPFGPYEDDLIFIYKDMVIIIIVIECHKYRSERFLLKLAATHRTVPFLFHYRNVRLPCLKYMSRPSFRHQKGDAENKSEFTFSFFWHFHSQQPYAAALIAFNSI